MPLTIFKYGDCTSYNGQIRENVGLARFHCMSSNLDTMNNSTNPGSYESHTQSQVLFEYTTSPYSTLKSPSWFMCLTPPVLYLEIFQGGQD